MCVRYHYNGNLLDDGSHSNGRHCPASSRHIPVAWNHGHKESLPELSQGILVDTYLLCLMLLL